MTAARSLGDIAVDLTENSAVKTTKLNVGIKNQVIMASNGSLVSTGGFHFILFHIMLNISYITGLIL